MERWLKALGTHDERIPESGLASIGWITSDIGFPVRPSVRAGDRLVLYASGYGHIFGLVEVNGAAELDNRADPWSYRVLVTPRLVLDSLAYAPDLARASVSTRNLRRSVQQKSHLRLEDNEYDAAVEALEAAFDQSHGDVRRPSITGTL